MGTDLGPGDQTDMAFMNTPVTHGSGTLMVTGTGSETELGKISAMLSATAKEKTPSPPSSTGSRSGSPVPPASP